MRIGKWWVAALMAIALPLSAKDVAKPEDNSVESVVAMQVNGWVDFGTAGHVEDYRIDTRLDDSLRAALDGAVRKWKFEPVRVDGVARRATTRMRVTLTAHPAADGTRVRVDNVIFPAGAGDVATRIDGRPEPITGKILRPPVYPVELMMQHVSGATLLAILVGPDGRAADVLAVQSMLFDVRGSKSDLRKGIRGLERAAIDAAKSWSFNLPASDKPRAVDEMIVTVPVEFVTDKSKLDAAGKWRTIVRMPKRPIGWMTPSVGSQNVGVADAVGGELIPTRSAVALASHVIGTDLL